jgi:hypothetical protein
MNPNIDMTYTRSFIDVFFWNAVYDIYPKKNAQGIHEEGVLATINIWADFYLPGIMGNVFNGRNRCRSLVFMLDKALSYSFLGGCLIFQP